MNTDAVNAALQVGKGLAILAWWPLQEPSSSLYAV